MNKSVAKKRAAQRRFTSLRHNPPKRVRGAFRPAGTGKRRHCKPLGASMLRVFFPREV